MTALSAFMLGKLVFLAVVVSSFAIDAALRLNTASLS